MDSILSTSSLKRIIGLVLIFILCYALYYIFTHKQVTPFAVSTVGLKDILSDNWLKETSKFDLSFVPKDNNSAHNCHHFFDNSTPVAHFLSRFDANKKEFDELFLNITKQSVNDGEGFSDTFQLHLMQYFVRHPFVRTVCETGFNYGHSSYNFLSSNPNIVLHSFDNGGHRYTKTAGKWMKDKYPNRFHLHFGDSRQTLPRFISEHKDLRCDLISVDGGHSYEVAIADLNNFVRIARSGQSIVRMDDCPLKEVPAVNKAWKDMLQNLKIQELAWCDYNYEVPVTYKNRAVSVGLVIN